MLRRVCNVSVDQRGVIKIIGNNNSIAAGSYILCENTMPLHVDILKSRKFLVDWIEKCVFGDLRTLKRGMFEAKKRKSRGKLGGGNFLLASGCFMALEYLAYIYSGKDNATINIRRYTDKFLIPVNDRYKDMMELLWRSFRNGLIHCSWPQLMSREEDNSFPLLVGVGNSLTDDHLKATTVQGRPAFAISSASLLKDLYKSYNPSFKNWLLNEALEIALKRGNPQILKLRIGDVQGRRQLNHMLGIN